MRFPAEKRTVDMPLLGVQFTPTEANEAKMAASAMSNKPIEEINNAMEALGYFIVFLDKTACFTAGDEAKDAARKASLEQAAIFFRACELAAMVFFVSEKASQKDLIYV